MNTKKTQELASLQELLEKKDRKLFSKYILLLEYAKEEFFRHINIENFTDHGEAHVQNVVKNIFSLLTPKLKKRLSAFDVFCLLAVSCLHDIGMIKLESGEESYQYSRKEHHIRVRNLLKEDYKRFNLNKHEAEIIGQICYAHGISSLDELEAYEDWSIDPHGEVNVMLLAALLRIGDLTDLTFKRAPELIVDLKKIDGESRRHWDLHKMISNIKIDHKSKEITIVALANDEYELTSLYSLQKWAHKELLKVKEILKRNDIYLERISLHTNFHKKKVLSRENPFQKLDAYEWAKHAAFFGRDEEMKTIRRKVEDLNFLVLVGESGVGKTSLLNAGLKYQMIENGVYVIQQRVSESFQAEILKTLEKHFPYYKSNDPLSMLETLSRHGLELILVIDQFEEIFTFDSQNSPKFEILSFFQELLQKKEINLKIVLGIREDFLAEMWEAAEMVEPLYNRANTYRLKRFNRENGRQIIKNTLTHVDYSIENNLLEMLLEDFIAEEDSENIYPPYIQIVCHELFKKHREKFSGDNQHTKLGFDTYLELGKATKIISDYFEEILDGFSADERDVIIELMAPMVTYFHTKQRISYEEIEIINNDRIKNIVRTLERLVQHRIIKKIDSEKNEYELIHDFLAKKIMNNKQTAAVSSKIKKAVDYIDQNFDKPISSKEVAAHIGITTEHFCRAFKIQVKSTCMDYLNEKRVKEAKRYIERSPRIKINEIFEKVGFSNAQHFTKVFKKIFGYTPTDLKRRLLETE